MTERHRILSGHKRVKSRFVPPIMQILNLRETSYINEVLPHVLWMSLLNETAGLARGIDASFRLARLAHSIHATEKHVNFAVCGNYARLTPAEASSLVEELRVRGDLDLYREALSPLIHLHPACPLQIVGLPLKIDDQQTLVGRLRSAVDVIFDRHATPGVIVQANVINIRAATGGLFVAKHIEVPDFDSLIQAPESEAAKRAASFARIGAMQEFMLGEERGHSEWSRSFWNANYRLDACMPLEISDD